MAEVSPTTAVPANGFADVDLGVFNRFGGRGGGMVVRNTVAVVDAGGITVDVNVGSDQTASGNIVPVESAPGVGPDQFTRMIEGRGAPGDVLLIRLRNSTPGIINVTSAITIVNLA